MRRRLNDFRKFSFRFLVFIALAAVSSMPIVGLTFWVQKTAVDKEVAAVAEKHLIVAGNLSMALSRYVQDIQAVFTFATDHLLSEGQAASLGETFQGLDIAYIAILNAENQLVQRIPGLNPKSELPSDSQIEDLRELAATSENQIAVSGLERLDGKPYFLMARSLPDKAIAVAPLSPRYLIEVQKSIAFGERGHSMIVDQYGRVVAHPNQQWQDISKDASKLSVVQKMMSRGTGVAEFYSPPMKADMIAGYTFVPETGWGVMVPQPKSELIEHASEVEAAGLVVAAIMVAVSILMSLWLSKILHGPIGTIAECARRVSSGDLTSRVELRGGLAPRELSEFASVFNHMIEDLKCKSDHLVDALSKAEAGSRSKTQFMAVMSHEIRTPMNGVFGILELLEGTDLDEEQRQYVSVAQNSCNSLIQIVDDILDFSQMQAGKLSISYGSVDMRDTACEVTRLFQPLADKKSINLRFRAGPSLPDVVWGDRLRIRQILFNLVGNAVKFTDTGAIVTAINYSPRSESTGEVTVSVSDTGMGIPEEKHAAVFEDFSQCDASYSRKHGGTGLGLAISKRLVELMNGTISFDSKQGVGSCFKFTIPVTMERHSDDCP